jgi:hypothetical protein
VPPQALPDDVGLPTAPRPPAAPVPDVGEPADEPPRPASRTSGATPTTDAPTPAPDVPPTAPAPDVDRAALAAAGADLARTVTALLAGAPAETTATDPRTLAVAATGGLAARLPALSGVDPDASDSEADDELLHAYADLLVTRAQDRAGADREDLLAVAHVAAAAAAVGAADEPALLLLAGVPPEDQLRAAAVLLAQTADDGGGAPDRLGAEVRELFQG